MSTESDGPGWPEGVGRSILTETDSSNAEAMRIAPGLDAPCWILALHQSAARGRRGRPWAMPKGNFAATYVTRVTEPPAQVALRSFVAALALHDALAEVTGQPGLFALKWPNDVLLKGGKVAGILLESMAPHLAVGFGVNLVAAPDRSEVEAGATPPVSLAAEAGMRVGPAGLLAALAPAYDRWERRFVAEGFDPIRAAWLARATRLGEVVTARVGNSATTGIFDTVDASGALVLATRSGRRAIPAADVYF